MSKFRQLQSSFAYGLLSEEATARADLDFVKQGCSTLENFVVEPIGGIRKRIGSKLVNYCKPFGSSEHGYKYVAIKGSTDFLVRWTDANVTQYAVVDENFTLKYQIGSLSEQLSLTQVGELIITTHTNHLPHVFYKKEGQYTFVPYYKYLIKEATDTDSLALQYKFLPFDEWNINRNEKISAAATTGNTTLSFYKAGSLFPYWNVNSLGELVGANYIPSSTWVKALWQITQTPVANGIVTQSAGTGVFTDQVSIPGGLFNIDYYEVLCLSSNNESLLQTGATYFIKKKSATELYLATSYVNLITGTYFSAPTSISVSLLPIRLSTIMAQTLVAPPDTTQTYAWSRQAWNADNGYPKKTSFVGTRLIFAGTNKDTEAIWMSSALNILQFNNLRFYADQTATSSAVGLFGAINDTDAHLTRATSAQYNRTSWILNADELTVGCQGGIFILNRSDNGDYLPQKTTSSALSYDSAADVEPTMMEFGIVFVDESKKNIKFIDFRADKKGVNDISLLVAELFTNIRKIVYQRSTKTLWILDENTLKSFTLSTFTNVAGFSTHPTNLIEELVPGYTKSIGDIFLDSSDRLCLTLDTFASYEAVARFESASPQIYMDFYQTKVNVVASSTWDFSTNSMLWAFRNNTIDCYVDGVYCTGSVSSNGKILTTSLAGLNLVCGKKYTAKMTTVNLDVGGTIGSAIGATKRADEVVLGVKNTKNLYVGGKTLYLSKTTQQQYSGEISEKVSADPSTTAKITVESRDNDPCHILYAVYKGFTQE